MYFSREAMNDSVKEANEQGQGLDTDETVPENQSFENSFVNEKEETPVTGGKFIFNLDIDSAE